MDNLKSTTLDLVVRLLGDFGKKRNLNITLHTPTTLVNSSQVFVFKHLVNGQKDLKYLYSYATKNNFTMLFYPNYKEEEYKNWFFADIDRVNKDKFKIITSTLAFIKVDDTANLLDFCTIVGSGTGVHLYIELDFSLVDNEYNQLRSIVQKCLLKNGVEIDNKNQMDRMRMPGSLNEKYGTRSNVIIYSEGVLSQRDFNSFVIHNQQHLAEVKENVNKSDYQEKAYNLVENFDRSNIKLHNEIDIQYAYFNTKTGKIATRKSCGELVNYFYQKNNGGRWNTVYQLFGFLYVIGVLQNKRDLYRYLGKIKAYSRELFSKKDSDFYDNDEYFAVLNKCKWVNELKEGDFDGVEFKDDQYRKFFTADES